ARTARPRKRGRRLDRSRPPALGPAPSIRLPRYHRSRLRNGLKVLAVPHDDLPEVAVELLLPVSTADDPDGQGGLAVMTARALSEGTRTKSAQEVAEAFDELGASFQAEVGADATVLTVECLEPVLADALELVVELLVEPAFDPKEVSRLRDERLDEIARGLDEPHVVANLRLLESIFGSEHAYGRPEGGRKEEIERIDAAAVRRFHARTYTPHGATLVLVGAVQPDELPAQLATLFGRWSTDFEKRATIPADAPAAAHGVLAVHRESSPQSEIRLGGLGLARRDPDYFAFKLMNAILGGLFNSRVNMNLREDKGWTYGAYTRFETHHRPGPFYATTAVDANVTADAFQELVREVEGLREAPPRDDEFRLAQNALSLSLPRILETPAQVAAQVAEQVVYRLPDDYWEQYIDAITALTPNDIVRVARRYLRPERWSAVVVGDAEPHLARLADFGDVTVEPWRR
ncbi:MAG: M16 family metallopeptidase, partial [Gemmatimonadota bacterium]